MTEIATAGQIYAQPGVRPADTLGRWTRSRALCLFALIATARGRITAP